MKFVSDFQISHHNVSHIHDLHVLHNSEGGKEAMAAKRKRLKKERRIRKARERMIKRGIDPDKKVNFSVNMTEVMKNITDDELHNVHKHITKMFRNHLEKVRNNPHLHRELMHHDHYLVKLMRQSHPTVRKSGEI